MPRYVEMKRQRNAAIALLKKETKYSALFSTEDFFPPVVDPFDMTLTSPPKLSLRVGLRAPSPRPAAKASKRPVPASPLLFDEGSKAARKRPMHGRSK